jgi:hypothetical protein
MQTQGITLGVLAGAYKGGQLERSARTHWVRNGWDSDDVKTPCGQLVERLADPYSNPAGNDDAPTCHCCARARARALGLPKPQKPSKAV